MLSMNTIDIKIDPVSQIHSAPILYQKGAKIIRYFQALSFLNSLIFLINFDDFSIIYTEILIRKVV